MNERQWKEAWASQTVDAIQLSREEAEMLELETTSFRRRIRQRNARENVAGLIAILVFFAYACVLDSILMRVGSAMIIVATLFVLSRLRNIDPKPLAGDAIAQPIACHYRDELARQYRALETAWLWYVGPFIPGLVVLAIGQIRLFGNFSGWIGACASLGVCSAVAVINRRAARRLQLRIEELDLMLNERRRAT